MKSRTHTVHLALGRRAQNQVHLVNFLEWKVGSAGLRLLRPQRTWEQGSERNSGMTGDESEPTWESSDQAPHLVWNTGLIVETRGGGRRTGSKQLHVTIRGQALQAATLLFLRTACILSRGQGSWAPLWRHGVGRAEERRPKALGGWAGENLQRVSSQDDP